MSETNDTALADLLKKPEEVDAGKKPLPKGVSSQRVSPLLVDQYAQSKGSVFVRSLIDLWTRLPNPNKGQVSIAVKKQMRLDPTLYLGMTMLKAPLLTVEWWVEGKDEASNKAAALCQEVIGWHYATLARLGWRCLDWGWQPFKVLWGYRDVKVINENLGVDETFKSALVPVKFIDIDPEEVFPLVDPVTRDFIGIELSQSWLINTTGRPRIPRETLFVTSHDPEYGDPRGRSLYDNAYKAWWASELVQFMSLRYFERKGDPPLIGRAPSTGKVKDPDTGEEFAPMDHMLGKLHELRHGNEMVLSSEYDEFAKQYLYSAEVLKEDQRGEMFSDFTEFLDNRKLMGLGIPPKVLLPGSKVGTYAETKEQGGTFNVALEAQLRSVWIEAINSQLIGPITTLNFDGDVKRPEYKCDSFVKTDLAFEREIIKGMFEAKRKIRGSGGEVMGEGTGYQLIDVARYCKSKGLPTIDTDQFEEVEQPQEMAARVKQETDAEKLKLQSEKQKQASGPSGKKVRNTLTE